MRIIKFRGKTTDEVGDRKIWIYGDLLQGCEICNIYEISDCESIDGIRYQVEPNSIGQYTGLRDKNGKEIYEGDIIRTNFGKNFLVKWIYRLASFCYVEILKDSEGKYFLSKELQAGSYEVEVIRKHI